MRKVRNAQPSAACGVVVSIIVVLLFLTASPMLSAPRPEATVRKAAEPVRNEYLVMLKTTGRTAVVAEALAGSYGGHVERVWQPINSFLVNIRDAANVARLRADPRVKFVEQDSTLSFASGAQLTHSDPACNLPGADCQLPISTTPDNRLWHLDRIDQDSPVLDGTYTYAASGSGVYVYVVDTGVMRDHSEFGATAAERHARVLPGYDATTEGLPFGTTVIPSCPTPGDCPPTVANDRTNFFATAPCGGFPSRELRDGNDGPLNYFRLLDISAHGTSVASLIAGQHVGVAKNATVIPVKVTRCSQSEIWIPHRAYRFGTILRASSSDSQLWRVDQQGVSGATFPSGELMGGTVRLVKMNPLSNEGPLESAMVDGICWILQDTAHRPAIVNFSTFLTGTSECLKGAIQKLTEAGVTVIASANNAHVDAGFYMPGGLSDTHDVVTVGGSMLFNNPDGDLEAPASNPKGPGPIKRANVVNPRDALWRIGPGDTSREVPNNTVGSNYGPLVTLFAPARNITSALMSGPFDYRDGRVGFSASGTSFSAPITAGVAARLLSMTIHPTTPSAVRQTLKNTAIPDILETSTLKGSPNLLLRASDVMFGKQPSQPNDSVEPINQGASTTLTVVVYAACPNITYTWYEGADREHPDLQPVVGHGSTLPIAPGATSYYFVVVTADNCSTAPSVVVSNTSRVTRVVVRSTLSFTGEPRPSFSAGVPPRLAPAAFPIVLVAPAMNGSPVSYNWYEGGIGQTASPLSLHTSSITVMPMQPTKYWVRAIALAGDYLDSDPLAVEVAVANTISQDSTFVPFVPLEPAPSTTLTLQGDPYDTELLRWTLDDATVLSCTGPTCRPAISSAGAHKVSVALEARPDVNLASTDIVGCTAGFTAALTATASGELIPTLDGGMLNSSYTLQWFEGPTPASVGSTGSAVGNTKQSLPKSIGRALGDPVQVSGDMKYTPLASNHDRAFWFRLSNASCFSDSPEAVIHSSQTLAGVTLKVFETSPQLTLVVEGADPLSNFQWYRGEIGNTGYPIGEEITLAKFPNWSPVIQLDKPEYLHRWWLNLTTAPLPAVPAAVSPLKFWVRVYTRELNADELANPLINRYSIDASGVCFLRRHAVNPPPQPPPGPGANGGYDLSVTLDPGEAASVAWFAQDSQPLRQIGTGQQIHVTPSETTSYWAVITALCNQTMKDTTPPITLAAVGITHDVDLSRVISVGGTPKTYAMLSPPQNASDLSIPADLTNTSRYEWRKGDQYDVVSPVLSTTRFLSVTGTGSYWVRTIDSSGHATDSAVTRIVNHPPTTPPDPAAAPSVGIDVFPGPGTVLGTQGSLALTALPYPTHPAGVTYQYQWRQASEHQTEHTLSEDASFPVLNSDPTSPVLWKSGIVGPIAFWVRVITPTGIIDSEPVLVTVACDVPPNFWIFLSPPDHHVAADTPVILFAQGAGRNLGYQWYSGLLGDVSHPVGSGGSVFWVISPDGPYWVHGTDDCGRSADAATTVYKCKPTIPEGGNPHDAELAPEIPSVELAVTGVPAKPGHALLYQWYAGNLNLPISGKTDRTLTVTQPGTFFAVVSSVCDDGVQSGAQSSPATVSVCYPPAIVSHAPATQWAVIESGGATVWVNTTGNNLTYQWYAGESGITTTPIFGATNSPTASSLTVTPHTTTRYWVRVSGSCGSKDSDTMLVNACGSPAITTQPQGSTIMSGLTATMSVTASDASTTPLTYQWYRGVTGDTSNPAGTGSSPTFTTPALTAETSYWVRVSCGVCSPADSEAATVHMCAPPAVSWATSPHPLLVGELFTLQINAPPAGSRMYWYRGESGDVSNPMGSTDVTYTQVLPNAPTSTYWVRVQTDSCYADAPTFTLNVCVPTITQQPAGGPPITLGGSATLSVVATTTPLTYQWYKGASGDISQPIAGATGATYTASPASDTLYWVRVTGSCGVAADSNAALVSVCFPPAIVSTAPITQWAIIGSGSATVSVNATGSNLTYQWYFGNSGNTAAPISATTSSLTVTPQNTTSYWARVSGSCGSPQNSVSLVVNVCGSPAITAQPQGSTINSGATATMSVAATEATTTTMTYQWYRGVSGDVSTPVGTGLTSFTTPVLTATTSYWVRVSCGICSPADSQTATVSVCNNAQPLGAPADQYIAIGQTATLSTATASGNVYQWYIGASGNTSQPAPGTANQSSYAASPSVTTQYWVQIQNGGCTFRTQSATVNVCVPTITQQPASIMINPGTSTTLSVAANTPGLTYQWYVGNSGITTSPISGGTNSTATVSPSTTTNYWVRVTGSCGQSVNSAPATVTICAPPAIIGAAQTQSIVRNNSTSCFVTATGTNLTYQWYVGASGITTTPISGATGSSVSVTPQNTTSYWVRVTGACGTVNSAAMLVNVCATPSISAQPQGSIIFSGGTASMSVTATEGTTTPMTYQWYRGASGDTSAPVGTNSTGFTTPALTAQTSYWVRVSCGICNPADSQAATISICYYPQMLSSPGDFYNTAGQSVRLYTSNGSGNTYQWYTGASGDTSHPYYSPYSPNMYYADVAPAVTTQYWVQVLNGGCVSRTATANVYVCIPTFTQQPASITIAPGSSTTLSASANTAGVTYQWYAGASGNTGAPIAGATGPSVSVTPGSDTSYWVRAIGTCGHTTDSVTATVVLCSPPVITGQPNASTVYGGSGTANMWVYATGSNLSYQWYIGSSGDTSTPINGATSSASSMWIWATQKIWVRITGPCGAVNSNATFANIPAIITQQPPDSLVVGYNTTATISLSASGSYLSYVWKNSSTGAVIATTTTPTLITPSITADTYIYCQVYSGNATTNAYETALRVCYNGPNVSIVKAPNGSCSVAYSTSNGADDYQWYQGARGDTSHPVGNGSTALSVCPTAPTQYWLRAIVWSSYQVVSCYSDSNSVTLP